MIERLCIVGLGLIGGSVALAARECGLARTIVGADADSNNLAAALSAGLVHRASDRVADAARHADFVMIAVPVGAYDKVFEELRPGWDRAVVYTDAGSTKRSVLDAAERCFGRVPGNFVPGHPIAGAERSGAGAAAADLFSGKRVILTPGETCDVACVERVRAFWTALGAIVSSMDAARHDAVLAATSHLPHVLAFSLVHLLGLKDEQEELLQYSAGGFRDFTRIASSDPTMWRDICLGNREPLLRLIGEFQADLGHFAEILRGGSGDRLFDYLASARAARQRYLTRMGSSER